MRKFFGLVAVVFGTLMGPVFALLLVFGLKLDLVSGSMITNLLAFASLAFPLLSGAALIKIGIRLWNQDELPPMWVNRHFNAGISGTFSVEVPEKVETCATLPKPEDEHAA